MPAKITDKGENTWLLCVSDGFTPGGKRDYKYKTVKAKTPQAAERAWSLFYSAVQRGDIARQKPKTLRDFYAFWLEHHAMKQQEASTRLHNANLWTRIDENMGKIRIDKLQPKHILEFYNALSKTGVRKDLRLDENGELVEGQRLDLSGTFVRMHHTFLNSMLNMAVKWGFLAKNPCAAVEPPKREKAERTMLNEDQLASFLDKLLGEDLRHRCMVYLGLTGGLCREEIFGLHWEDIDLDAGTVVIDRARVYVSGTGVVLKDCKNSHRHRKVSLPPDAVALLKQHRIKEIEKKLKQGTNWKDSPMVFTSWDGSDLHPHAFGNWLKRFCKDNGFPSVGTHVFRHLSATFLIMGGADVRTVSGKLGHANTKTTLTVYAHLVQSAETATANIMQDVLSGFKAKSDQAKNKQAQ